MGYTRRPVPGRGRASGERKDGRLDLRRDRHARAVAAAFTRLRIVLEPGGAVALAAALFHREGGQDVIVVASGGNADPKVFAKALNQGGKTD